MIERKKISVCGKTRQFLEVPDCVTNVDSFGKETTASTCKRSFYLYVPTFFCKVKDEHSTYDTEVDEGLTRKLEIDSNTSIPFKVNGDLVPLVFSMHCYQCTYKQMEHWTSIADDYKFVLVLPEGIQNSWNARYCCGYALENGIDDYSFLSGIIDMLTDKNTYKEETRVNNEGVNDYIDSSLLKLSRDNVYGVGWSNGGYMVTYAADLFQAVAPISGHQYELTDFPKTPTSIFMHHGSRDTFVRPNGCCIHSTTLKCCCGISNTIDQCSSISDVFEEWAKYVNQCQTDENGKVLISKEKDEIKGIECYAATGSCLAETKYCMHANESHFNYPSFKEAFPMSKNIADFFASDACLNNNGIWNSTEKKCNCNDEIHMGGLYCATPLNHKFTDTSFTSEQGEAALVEIGSAWISAVGILVLFVLFKFFRTKI